jgi:3D (Asp-Asp-Asp) domain-containing protein
VIASVLLGALAAGGGSARASAADDRPYRLKVDAVAYHLPGRTALGVPVGKGVVAVDPKLIPLGTRLHVPGYGPGLAADVGTAIKGRIIDLWFPSTAAARKWGRRTVRITVYG